MAGPVDGNRDRAALATRHHAGQWRAAQDINRVRRERLFDDRVVRAYARRPATYDALFRESVARNPAGEAIVCGVRRLTYAALDARVTAVAAGLQAAGIAPGDRVAVLLDNCLEFFLTVLGAVRAGAIAVPLGTRLGPADLAYIVGHARPKLVVTARASASKLPDALSPSARYLIDEAAAGAQPFSQLETARAFAPVPLKGEDVMMLIYTSGTTGKPKGACLAHVNFVHSCLHYRHALGLDAPERGLLVVPASHIAGFLAQASIMLTCAGSLVMMPQFKASAVIETLAAERITYAVLVPAMYQLLLREAELDRADLRAWRFGIYGGAIMPPAAITELGRRLPNLHLVNAYGATETCAVCTIMPPERTAERPASVGLPLECCDLVVVDSAGREVAPGETGELWIKGPNVIPRYWEDEAATTRSFCNGYWMSGDVASRDAEGFVYIHDRIKDMVNRGGFKIFSAEVENALMAHGGVADCAVVGVPDPILGERTFALVQRRASEVTAEDLSAFLAARIADYKVPDHWQVGDAPVPRNQNGKLQKAEVRALAAQLADGQKAARSSASTASG